MLSNQRISPVRPSRKNICRTSSIPAPFLRIRCHPSQTSMEVAACASGDGSDSRAALCASPALSQVPPAPLPAAFLPPAMTLAELTALATNPDALKAFVDGQPSSAAVATGTRGQGLRCSPQAHDADAPTRTRLSSDVTRLADRRLAAGGRPGEPFCRRVQPKRRLAWQTPRASLFYVPIQRSVML